MVKTEGGTEFWIAKLRLVRISDGQNLEYEWEPIIAASL